MKLKELAKHENKVNENFLINLNTHEQTIIELFFLKVKQKTFSI